jgi:DNA invertase Pin-like site-specific DNA recombinase
MYNKYIHSQKIKAALRRAKDSGLRLGRPVKHVISEKLADQICKLRMSGFSEREIARRTNIPRTSIRLLLKKRLAYEIYKNVSEIREVKKLSKRLLEEVNSKGESYVDKKHV